MNTNTNKEALPSLFNLSLRLEYLSDLLTCCNVFYEQFIKVSDNALTDRYRAALYCMIEQGDEIASELVKISNRIYEYSPEATAQAQSNSTTESNTAPLRYLDLTTTNEKEDEHE